MPKEKLLVVGDHFISPSLMRGSLGDLAERVDVVEAATPFPLEPFHDIAEVREASGSEEQMIEQLQGVSLCVVHHAPLTKRILENAPGLKLFVVCRGGPVNVNVPAATEHGVLVAYTPARNAAATAEHTIALLLAALRGVPEADAGIRKGEWKGDYTWDSAGFELGSATVGLIGYGAIGRLVARILLGFGSRVLVYDPHADAGGDPAVEQVSLDILLQHSQVISLHARETEATRGMVGREELAKLPRGAVVVNCARGSLMNYSAVAEALQSGQLFAAAADVFPTEPLPPDSVLLDLPNFILTPHIAGGTRQAAAKAAAMAAQELRLFLDGNQLRYCANPQLQVSHRA